MQLRTIFSTLVLALALSGHSVLAEPIPRSDSDHKFAKRSPGTHIHNHYHGSAPASSSGGGMFGGGMGKTILGGTALAGGAAFAGTAASIGAHKLFDGDEEQERHEGGGEGERQPVPVQQPQYAPPLQQPAQYAPAAALYGGYPAATKDNGPRRPVAILMSDGSTEPIPAAWLQQSSSAIGGQQMPQYASQPQTQPQTQPEPDMGSPFVFPPRKSA